MKMPNSWSAADVDEVVWRRELRDGRWRGRQGAATVED